ncbi:MAG: hypothetical protein R2699_12710 [Acidimicrobiales bacterium]
MSIEAGGHLHVTRRLTMNAATSSGGASTVRRRRDDRLGRRGVRCNDHDQQRGSGGGVFASSWISTTIDRTEISGNTAPRSRRLRGCTDRATARCANVASTSGGGIRASNATIERTEVTETSRTAGLYTNVGVTFGPASTPTPRQARGRCLRRQRTFNAPSTISGNVAPGPQCSSTTPAQLVAATVATERTAPTFDGSGNVWSHGSIVDRRRPWYVHLQQRRYNIVSSAPCGNLEPVTASPAAAERPRNNGGPTRTHRRRPTARRRLHPGGHTVACEWNDQRHARPTGGA